MYALATTDRRRGVTLTEVLVAIFIMAIGLMALLTLFPLGALNMAQAIKDDRTGTTASNSAATAQALWRILYEKNSGNPDSNLTPWLLNSGQATWGAAYPDLSIPGSSGQSYPVYIDPFGYNGLYSSSPAWQHWLAGTAGTIPRYSAASPVPAPVPPLTVWSSTIGNFSNNDDLTFGEIPPGQVNAGQAGVPPNFVERRRQYSCAWLVRQTSVLDPSQLNLTVVVYSGRPLQPSADPTPQGESLYAGNFGQNTVTLTWGAGQDRPAVRRGSWILDATITASAGSGAQGGYFYRVVDITDLGTSLLLELQTAAVATGQRQVVVLDGVSEVFQELPVKGTY
jgi:prepilin-type N-terminal cleavage/methylation domain-containing protein